MNNFIAQGLAATLVLWALTAPISTSATFFPLFAAAAFGVVIRFRGGYAFPSLPRIRLLFTLWMLLFLWRSFTVIVSRGELSVSPALRALDFLPVFVLAGLECAEGWKQRISTTAFYVIAYGSSFLILLGLFQAISGMYFPLPFQLYRDGKLLALFSHHIPAAGFFSVLLFCSLSFFLFSDLSRRAKWLVGVLILILFAGTLATMARTYLVSFCCTLPFMLLKKDVKTAVIGTLIAVFCICGALILIPSFKARVMSITDVRANISNVERLYLWRVARDMVQHNPVYGVGYKHWRDEVDTYSARYSSEWNFSTASIHHAHNVYLTVAAETGIVGLVLFLSFWGYLVFMVFRISHVYGHRGTIAALNLGAAFSMINLLIGGMFEDNLGTLVIALLMSFVLTLSLFVAPPIMSTKTGEALC